jgi:hypothetical protein
MRTKYEHWVWLEIQPDGTEGMIVAMHPSIGGMIPLAHRHRDIAEDHFGPIAEKHGKETGRPVRLAHMREVTLEW